MPLDTESVRNNIIAGVLALKNATLLSTAPVNETRYTKLASLIALGVDPNDDNLLILEGKEVTDAQTLPPSTQNRRYRVTPEQAISMGIAGIYDGSSVSNNTPVKIEYIEPSSKKEVLARKDTLEVSASDADTLILSSMEFLAKQPGWAADLAAKVVKEALQDARLQASLGIAQGAGMLSHKDQPYALVLRSRIPSLAPKTSF